MAILHYSHKYLAMKCFFNLINTIDGINKQASSQELREQFHQKKK